MKILLTLLSVLLLNTGCLTGGLSGKIIEQKEVGREWRDITLKGRKSDTIMYKQKKYQKYEFCGFHKDPARILEVWIPFADGEVILKEHRNYLLEGELPLTMESVFGIESNFKGTYYKRVNFKGEEIVILPDAVEFTEEEKYKPLNFNIGNTQEEQENNKEELLNALKVKKMMRDFQRPIDAGDKWYLMTTRIEHPLSLSKRTGTRYFLSTPKRRLTVNPDKIAYEYRSWLGKNIMKSAYVLTVPVDIVITPVIFIGVGCIGIYQSIFN